MVVISDFLLRIKRSPLYCPVQSPALSRFWRHNKLQQQKFKGYWKGLSMGDPTSLDINSSGLGWFRQGEERKNIKHFSLSDVLLTQSTPTPTPALLIPLGGCKSERKEIPFSGGPGGTHSPSLPSSRPSQSLAGKLEMGPNMEYGFGESAISCQCTLVS